MYEGFFEMEHTPFTVCSRDGKPGLRKASADTAAGRKAWQGKYMLLYLSDSKLTPRWLYAGLLGQPGLEPRF